VVVKKLKSMGPLAAIVLVLAGSGLAAADTPPSPAPAGSTLEQRTAQRKTERGTALSNNDQQRLVSTCRSAQTKIRTIQTAEVPMLDNRSQVYGSIDAKLWIVTGQLKLAKQDTFQLEKLRLALLAKSDNFQTAATNYKQALDDSLVINCQADPNGFKALLDTARIYNDQLRTQSADSHDYVVNTIKPALSDFVTKLQPKSPGQETQ
jgi:hypothetical protein